MRALVVARPGPLESHPLEVAHPALPQPGPDEVRLEVEVCGVCRTDLHVAEGDLAPRKEPVVPGHEVVGRVVERGTRAERFQVGDRVGAAWLHRSCGRCRFCIGGAENLCLQPLFTGWDVDGGYADQCVVPEAFGYPIPDGLRSRDVAPLLCAGIIGYRAYERCGIQPGGRLGLYGFGGSAHIVIQVARHFDCEVYVMSRGGGHRDLALELGATWVGSSHEVPPHELDAAILFAPVGDLVLPALEALDRGGRLAVAGIHLSDVPPLDYQRHLFQERELVSVTSNTRQDGQRLLELATRIPIRTHTVPYPLEEATRALLDLKHDRIRGAAVLEVAPGREGSLAQSDSPSSSTSRSSSL
jgi:propanol-preferring alcohol dehydrogenase